ncbi:MAG: hypothetical protein A2166_06780 [Omnitrophica WOR_2 bacterium RBG_13_41_10]|nr:MAG: hypothetical protein A2166_06780 [Omnitrophica WOR_2 bacterium RBG_13_41_10]
MGEAERKGFAFYRTIGLKRSPDIKYWILEGEKGEELQRELLSDDLPEVRRTNKAGLGGGEKEPEEFGDREEFQITLAGVVNDQVELYRRAIQYARKNCAGKPCYVRAFYLRDLINSLPEIFKKSAIVKRKFDIGEDGLPNYVHYRVEHSGYILDATVETNKWRTLLPDEEGIYPIGEKMSDEVYGGWEVVESLNPFNPDSDKLKIGKESEAAGRIDPLEGTQDLRRTESGGYIVRIGNEKFDVNWEIPTPEGTILLILADGNIIEVTGDKGEVLSRDTEDLMRKYAGFISFSQASTFDAFEEAAYRNLVEDPAPGFVSKEEFVEYLTENRQPVDYEALFRDVPFVILGETHAYSPGEEIKEHMEELVHAGITHIALEIIPTRNYPENLQELVNDYLNERDDKVAEERITKTIEPLVSKLLFGVSMSGATKQLFPEVTGLIAIMKETRCLRMQHYDINIVALGIPIVIQRRDKSEVDILEELERKHGRHRFEIHLQNRYMAGRLYRLIKDQPNAKVLTLVGFAHNIKIGMPALLAERGIKVKTVRAVSKGVISYRPGIESARLFNERFYLSFESRPEVPWDGLIHIPGERVIADAVLPGPGQDPLPYTTYHQPDGTAGIGLISKPNDSDLGQAGLGGGEKSEVLGQDDAPVDFDKPTVDRFNNAVQATVGVFGTRVRGISIEKHADIPKQRIGKEVSAEESRLLKQEARRLVARLSDRQIWAFHIFNLEYYHTEETYLAWDSVEEEIDDFQKGIDLTLRLQFRFEVNRLSGERFEALSLERRLLILESRMTVKPVDDGSWQISIDVPREILVREAIGYKEALRVFLERFVTSLYTKKRLTPGTRARFLVPGEICGTEAKEAFEKFFVMEKNIQNQQFSGRLKSRKFDMKLSEASRSYINYLISRRRRMGNATLFNVLYEITREYPDDNLADYVLNWIDRLGLRFYNQRLARIELPLAKRGSSELFPWESRSLRRFSGDREKAAQGEGAAGIELDLTALCLCYDDKETYKKELEAMVARLFEIVRSHKIEDIARYVSGLMPPQGISEDWKEAVKQDLINALLKKAQKLAAKNTRQQMPSSPEESRDRISKTVQRRPPELMAEPLGRPLSRAEERLLQEIDRLFEQEPTITDKDLDELEVIFRELEGVRTGRIKSDERTIPALRNEAAEIVGRILERERTGGVKTAYYFILAGRN